MEQNHRPLIVTIMAAGEGKRMKSIIPKVLHRFKEIPMLVRVIDVARQLSPQRILVVTGKYYDFIDSVLKQYTTIDDITYVDQARPLGTGDAIKSCLYYYDDDATNVLILNGDMPLINSDILSRFIASVSGSILIPGSIMCSKFENPTGYGRIITSTDVDEILVKIVEEKDATAEERAIQLVNSGVYLFRAAVLRTYIPMIENNNAPREYYLTDIVQLAHGIRAFVIPESDNKYIRGVNTAAELAALELVG